MLSRRIKIILVLVTSILALGIGQPARTQAAANPVNLVLGGSGATNWNMSNIFPGDNGTTSVTLHNAGAVDGSVTIWLSNLVSIEGPAKMPGKFADYLLLDISGSGIDTNLHFPVVIAGFPQSVSETNYVRIPILPAGATTTLVWKWQLPPQTGNDIQGNGVSFSINYMLEELHVPPTPSPAPVIVPEPVVEPTPQPAPPTPAPVPASPLQTLSVILGGGKTTTVDIGADGTLAKPLQLTDTQDNFVVNMDSGTQITGPNGIQLSRIELSPVTDQVKVADNMAILSPIYKITGYSGDAEVSTVNFSPFAVITMNYDSSKLPANALTPYIVNYTDTQGIVRLEPPPGSLLEAGKVQGIAFHASLFAVVAELAPPPLPLPAGFRLNNLIINPEEVRSGQPVSISVDIANDGASQGSYQLYLVIDGIVRTVKDVNVEPRSVVTVRFDVANLAPGNHQVKIGGLAGDFRIISITPASPGSPVNWTVIDLIVAAMLLAGALVSYLLIRRSRKQSTL